jgi:hypothetical protein
MTAKILLVNPPIYDFAAYDFWLKPYGLLEVAGFLRGKADFTLFDYLDRQHPFMTIKNELHSDQWGRGRFYRQKIPNPGPLANIPRYFRRFGLPRDMFIEFLQQHQSFNFALIQTTMTYWYQGVQEVISDIRTHLPKTKIVLGGNYVTLCAGHAEKLGADLLIRGTDLKPLWEFLNISPNMDQPALWQTYHDLKVGVLKLSQGCPFTCTYCSVPRVYGKFKARPMDRSLDELELLAQQQVKNIAFYDDALLFDAENVLMPFLEQVLKRNIKVNFHSPNALNARFITKELAELLVRAGFKTFYLGFESSASKWQSKTGSKVSSDELARAVKCLRAAGAEPAEITAYQILGHPHGDSQQLEGTMQFANSLGIRGTLADFSPIPGTADGNYCSKWVDMSEPLFQNKTAFPIILLGNDEVNRLKDIQRKLNRNLPK